MSFQKCPICNGFGSTGVGMPTGKPCHGCNGTGMVSEQTGNPPNKKTEFGGYIDLSTDTREWKDSLGENK